MMTSKALVTPAGRLSLPADMRKRHGLGKGGYVLVEDRGDAIVLRTPAQVVAHARELSRRMLADVPDATVADFLEGRRADTGDE